MARVKTFTNGGSLLPGDLNSIEDDYEFAFSTYRDLGGTERAGVTGLGLAAGTYVITAPGASNLDGGTASFVLPGGSSTSPQIAFYLDPADMTGNTRATKFRVRSFCVVNAVAPAITLTVGLYPVATWGGASAHWPIIATLGAVVAGSTIAFATPAASSATQSNSGDFAAPAAGWYALGVVTSGSTALNSAVGVRAIVQMRQV